MPREVEEHVYTAMKNFTVNFPLVLEGRLHLEVVRVPIKRFTLIGATDRADKVRPALRERFAHEYEMSWTLDSLALLIHDAAPVSE